MNSRMDLTTEQQLNHQSSRSSESIQVLLSILWPSVWILSKCECLHDDRLMLLKQIDREIQTAVDQQEYFHLLSDSKFLKKIVKGTKKILYLALDPSLCPGWTPNRIEHPVVSFVDPCTQILQSIYNHAYPEEKHDLELSFISKKEIISEALDQLEFLRNFLHIYGNGSFNHQQLFSGLCSIESVVLQLLWFSCLYSVRVLDDKEDQRDGLEQFEDDEEDFSDDLEQFVDDEEDLEQSEDDEEYFSDGLRKFDVVEGISSDHLEQPGDKDDVEDGLEPFHCTQDVGNGLGTHCFREDAREPLAQLGDTEDVDDYLEEFNDLERIMYLIHNAVKHLCFIPEPLELREDKDTPTSVIDEQVVGFFDFLIDKQRKQKMPSSDDGGAIFMVGDRKEEMEMIVDELRFLRNNLFFMLQSYSQEVSAVKEMESLSASTLAVIIETASLIYRCSHGNKAESDFLERADTWRYGLPDLLESIDSLKKQASDFYPHCKLFSLLSPRKLSGCPGRSTSHTASVDFVIKNLEGFIVNRTPAVSPLKHQIETLYHELKSMRECLMSDIVVDEIGNSCMEILLAQLKEIAYQSSLIIDSFSTEEGSPWCRMLGMFVVTNGIRTTYKEMKNVLTKMRMPVINVHSDSSNLGPFVSQSPHYVAVSCKDEMENSKVIGEAGWDDLVGLKNSASEVIQILTQNSPQLKILSIVGMPGLGKTTLANSVYNHPSINIHFHLRAWCSVSQVYERETLLAEILSQIVGKTNSSHEEFRGEDCAQRLYQSLRGRKYLIVIDDIWDVEVWYDLKNIFHDDHTGSRIIFTTRYHHVASKANSIPYALRLLSNEESCELLWSKIFGQETCPPELWTVSMRIARNCKGLPLLVTVMSGILKSTARRKESWEQVVDEVNRLRINRGKHLDKLEFTNILELSYNHLPYWLKSCFLYFGTFPEDTTILVSHLMRLWISEGFVRGDKLGQKSLEEEAKIYLDALVDRSLVMVAKRSSNGRIK